MLTAKTIASLDTPELSLSTLVLAQRVIFPHGYTEYDFVDGSRNSMRIVMTPDHKAIHDMLLNDEPIPMPEVYRLSAYINHADEFPDGPVNEDFLLLATTGQPPSHSVFTVDEMDPECVTWFYSEHCKNFVSGYIYNASKNDLRISCYADGELFEEFIPVATWKEITNPEEIAAFERRYADRGPLRDIAQPEDQITP